MSAVTRSVRDRLVSDAGFRVAALAGTTLLALSYLHILYSVTDVVGGSGTFVLVVVATVALATLLGRTLGVRAALGLTAILLVGGFAAYLLSIPQSQLRILSPERLLSDTVALLTGLSVLRLTGAGVWALAIAPAPTFLAWYLALRRRYVWSVVAGGLALSLFVLTSDATPLTTLVGVAGGAIAIGFGTLDREGGSAAQVDALVIVIAVMLVLAATVSVIPGGAAQPLFPTRGSSTVEANLVDTDDRITVLGSMQLSPEVRFTVDSPEPHYWQVAAFDRYTGQGWVRTGEATPYQGRLAGPAGASQSVEQTVTANGPITVMPAAWRPVRADDAGETLVTPQGGLRPPGPIAAGESYTVESRVPQYTSEQLLRTGTDYPEEIEAAYLQMPDSTPDRVRTKAAEIAGDADTPYEKAVAIEAWLEENKRYSLTVERPAGNTADAFLFEMDAGYCTYYATTMVALLRAQGVPSRLAVGYTPGEQTDDDRFVVRGLNAHAWVQVYFPEVGWVNFDPTPSTPRESAERTRITEARQSGEPGVDTEETRPETAETTTPESTGSTEATATPVAADEPADPNDPLGPDDPGTPPPDVLGSAGSSGGQADSGGGWFPPTLPPALPPWEALGFGLVALVGAVAAARRAGLTAGGARFVRMLYQGARRDPDADVERAFGRLELHLARAYRPRRPGETPRAYLRALSTRGLDDRAFAVCRAYERARYGPGVGRTEAEDAVSRVDAMVRESLPVVGKLF